jgi:hypothetical protein
MPRRRGGGPLRATTVAWGLWAEQAAWHSTALAGPPTMSGGLPGATGGQAVCIGLSGHVQKSAVVSHPAPGRYADTCLGRPAPLLVQPTTDS